MEDGTFRYRKPPKVSWFLEYGHGRPANVIVTAKGLVPVLSINEPEQPNLIVPDIMEIGGIEDLRSRTLFMTLSHWDVYMQIFKAKES